MELINKYNLCLAIFGLSTKYYAVFSKRGADKLRKRRSSAVFRLNFVSSQWDTDKLENDLC